MYSKHSDSIKVKELKQELQDQYKEGLRKEWSTEELQVLEGLLAERGWKCFLRYLFPLKEMVERRLLAGQCDPGQYKFMCGQWDVIERIRKMPEELQQMRQMLVEQAERERKDAIQTQ